MLLIRDRLPISFDGVATVDYCDGLEAMVDRSIERKTGKPKLSVVPEVVEPTDSKTGARARRKPHRVTLDLSKEKYSRLKFAAIAGRARGVRDGNQALDSMNVIIERALEDYLEKHPSLFQPLGPDDL